LGALTLHLGAPVFQPKRLRTILGNLREAFRIVVPYFMYIPLYGSQWSMACASDGLDPRAVDAAELDRRIVERRVGDLQYYNGGIHHAQCVIPNYLRRLLE
jgi:spermidine synthase